MWYCFDADDMLVDAFVEQEDAARYCRDHAGCYYQSGERLTTAS